MCEVLALLRPVGRGSAEIGNVILSRNWSGEEMDFPQNSKGDSKIPFTLFHVTSRMVNHGSVRTVLTAFHKKRNTTLACVSLFQVGDHRPEFGMGYTTFVCWYERGRKMEASYDAAPVKDSMARKLCRGVTKWRRSRLYLSAARPDTRCPSRRFVTPAVRRKGGGGETLRNAAVPFFSFLC